MTAGRPKKKIDKAMFEKLCQIQCTLEETAGVMSVSTDTIERWCKREYGENFAEVYKRFSAVGKMSVRRKQMDIAMKGNCSMLIWLGKQYLDQREQKEVSFGTSLEIDPLSKSLMELAKEYEENAE